MKIKQFKDFKICYRKGTADKNVISGSNIAKIFLKGKGIPEYSFKTDDVIIDIGAHIGVFSIFATSKLKNGKVYAIEASKQSFECLKRNIILNKFSNLLAYNLALTNFKGTTRLYHDKGNWGDTISKNISEQFEEVKTDTLANFMKDNNILRCDFMKLNCEGSEFEIILSTPKEILERIKTIFILYHSDLNENYSKENLIKYLQRCNFSTTIEVKSETRGWIIAKYMNHNSDGKK